MASIILYNPLEYLIIFLFLFKVSWLFMVFSLFLLSLTFLDLILSVYNLHNNLKDSLFSLKEELYIIFLFFLTPVSPSKTV